MSVREGRLVEENQQEMQVFEQKHSCVQEEPPACTAACPLRVDVRQMMAQLQKGKWGAALEGYRSAVLFPALVARLCTQPCRAACLRGSLDAPLEMRLVERALVAGLFDADFTERDLLRINLASGDCLRDVAFDVRGVSAHARLAALIG